MQLIEKIQAIIEPSLEALGYGVVLIRLSGSVRQSLQVTIERLDNEGVGIEDCVAASHQISALMDVEDPIEGAYTLEVSSPGLERPLTKMRHFEQFVGSYAKIQTHTPIEGRKRFSGMLQAPEGADIVMALEDQAESVNGEAIIVRIPLANISQARLKFKEEVSSSQGPKKGSQKDLKKGKKLSSANQENDHEVEKV